METVVEIGKRRILWRNIFVFGLLISFFIALVVYGVFTYAVKFHCEDMKSNYENAAEPQKKETINFLWFSDLHVDLYYNASSSPDYTTSFCRNPNMLAGYVAPYGRMGCDSPKSLLRSTLYAMKAVHMPGDKGPKFILLTGIKQNIPGYVTTYFLLDYYYYSVIMYCIMFNYFLLNDGA